MEKNMIELNKARLDLAWKHFEHYAKQRVTMFNFHIILVGAVLYALATLTKDIKQVDNLAHIQSLIAAFGVLISFVFLGLDRRNQYLYRLAEHNIFLLELQFLYKKDGPDIIRQFVKSEFKKNPDMDFADLGRRHYRGIVAEEFYFDKTNESVLTLEERGCFHNCIHNLIKYRNMMFAYYILVMVVFFALTLAPQFARSLLDHIRV